MLVLLVVAIMATWQIIEIWRHASLFASWRAEVETWDGWLGELLTCPFCLSVWVALIVSSITLWYELRDLTLLPVYAFAVSRGANLANDVFHSVNRTPRPGDNLAGIDWQEEQRHQALDAEYAVQQAKLESETQKALLADDDDAETHPSDR